MTSISKIALACAALVAASGAFAQKAGDNIVGLGLAYVSPDTNLGTLSNTTSGLTVGGPAGSTVGGLLAGTTAKVSSETTVSFSLLHMFTDNIGAEFTLGIPPRVTQDLSSPNLGSHSGAAKIDVWTPAAVAKYFFGTAQDTLRPYAGLGVSHVSFHNISIDSNAAVQALAGKSANLSSSWVPVYNAGVIYNIDDKWSINGSVSYLPVKTSATFVGANAGATTGDIKLNTTDYVIRLGYKF